MDRLKVAVVGCGNISDIYLESPAKFPMIEIAAVSDIDTAKATAQAEKYNISRVLTLDEILADDGIDIVLNLTIPSAHFPLCRAVVDAGKHVYVEKPLALSFAEGQELLAVAAAKGVIVGCAPDTFLGGGIQTCLNLIENGVIGVPVAAAGFMLSHGPEGWHPNPEFFYSPGGGPLFDMGPYYLTAMIALLGPISTVSAMTRISFVEREIGSGDRKGEKFTVSTPTHVAGTIQFASGAIGTLTTSFDVWYAEVPRIEIYGSEGTLSLPDPNFFAGPVRVRGKNDEVWAEYPIAHGYTDNSRGIGLADMALAIIGGGAPRASGSLALHVLEAMEGFLKSGETHTFYAMTSKVERPVALPVKWPEVARPS